MNLANIMSERSQTQKCTYSMTHKVQKQMKLISSVRNQIARGGDSVLGLLVLFKNLCVSYQNALTSSKSIKPLSLHVSCTEALTLKVRTK